MTTAMRSLLVSAALGAVAALGTAQVAELVAPRRAHADGNPATDGVARLVSYSGTLEVDGAPVTGSANLRFTLHDETGPVWSEDQVVTAYNGRFTAALGAATPIGPVITAADALALTITILNGPGDADDVELNGQQQFVPVPFAMWSPSASDLTVGRDALVGRDLVVLGSTRLNGPLTFDGRRTGAWMGPTDRSDAVTREYECPADQYLCGLQLLENSVGSGVLRNMRLKCCTLGL